MKVSTNKILYNPCEDYIAKDNGTCIPNKPGAGSTLEDACKNLSRKFHVKKRIKEREKGEKEIKKMG